MPGLGNGDASQSAWREAALAVVHRGSRVRAGKTELSEWPSTVTERWSGLGSVREFRGNSHVLLLCSITGSHVSLVCGTVVS